ncbi:MAG: MerR family transcriptional regulator [Rickettsiaceae bacterium]|nr:MerR family transcriptional regulator [Rickettsiaceae bacterium]
MLTKKYFSIAEAAKMTGLPSHKLRYIEKSDPSIKIIKIRERRYYTKNDIDYITKTFSTQATKNILQDQISKDKILAKANMNIEIIHKIDQLILKFLQLSKRIQSQ